VRALSIGRSTRPLTILCIGAHSDDIEIGCGGTVLRFLRSRSRVTVHWVVLCASGAREKEARASARRMLRRAHVSTVRIEHFRDAYLQHDGAAVKDCFEKLKEIDPDIVFTHYGDDAHQDHRFVSQLTWNTFRDHCILEYEIPKYDGDLGRPNVFVSIPPIVRREKVRLLMSAFATQRSKRWFSPSTFEGLMRLRGIESTASDGYAEAFFARKILLDPIS
jgi:LmbE family N-acetylglucosaminyl deacetylase